LRGTGKIGKIGETSALESFGGKTFNKQQMKERKLEKKHKKRKGWGVKKRLSPIARGNILSLTQCRNIQCGGEGPTKIDHRPRLMG